MKTHSNFVDNQHKKIYVSRQIIVDTLFLAGIFTLAMYMRMNNLTQFVTADEHNWVYRSSVFLNAILEKKWADTSVNLTPGVTTTWFGSIALSVYYRVHQDVIARPFLDWLTTFPRNKINLDVLLYMRWVMALFTAIMGSVIYPLAKKLWGRPVALLGTVLLVLEPHLLAVSRIIGHDAPVTFFMAVALLIFLIGRRQLLEVDSGYRWVGIAGIMSGLAILSKSVALFFPAFVALLLLIDILRMRRYITRAIKAAGWFGVLTWITFVLFWPAAWIHPLKQIWLVIANAFGAAVEGVNPDIQPYWNIPDLGNWYYVVNGAYKISPLMMIGLIFAAWVVGRKMASTPGMWGRLLTHEFGKLGLFAGLFAIMMTMGTKKSPRYILPIFPALSFLAAWGWLMLLRRLKPGLVIGGVSIVTLAITFVYTPYYFTYFNPLLGGSVTAPHIVRIGWGEGLDEVARWVNAQPDAFAARLGVRYKATVYPFFQGNLASPVSDELDYVAFYIKQTQSGYPSPEILTYFKTLAPLHRVVLNGVDYAQIYKGPAMMPVSTDASLKNMPIAYRPDTIYAPIGDTFGVTLLWPADYLKQSLLTDPVLYLLTEDGTISLQSQSPIQEISPGVVTSHHTFVLPHTLPRGMVQLRIKREVIGLLKARTMSMPPEMTPLNVVFNHQIKLIGLKKTIDRTTLGIELAWKGYPHATNDYTVFVQLLDETGERRVGVDLAPQPGFTTLDRGETMITHYDIPLTDDLTPGSYKLLVGLYYFAGNELVNVGSAVLEQPVIID